MPPEMAASRGNVMEQTVVLFSSDTLPALSEAGGKARALIQVTQANFPVPEGMVLCASFFAPWLEQLRSCPAWSDLRTQVTKEGCDNLKAMAEILRFTPEQQAAFDSALAQLRGPVFAVRSSSPEEDLAHASFAGMYETRLGVPMHDLEQNVARVFASMLDFRVMEYKRTHGLNVEQSKIAVIVQRQIASDVSGIGFSLNPHNNCYDEVVLNASFGLGEAIVSGIVTPDEYVVDVITNSIADKRIREKAFALRLSPSGGIVREDCAHPLAPALSDAQIRETAALIKRCEVYYGFPVDTEWAYEGGRLYLLQARPVTAYFPLYEEFLTAPGEMKNLYVDMIKLSQGFDSPLSELGGELFVRIVREALMTLAPVDKDALVYSVHGKIYMLANLLVRFLGKPLLMKTFGAMDAPNKAVLSGFSFEGYLPKRRPRLPRGALQRSLRLIHVVYGRVREGRRDFSKTVAAYQKSAAHTTEALTALKGSELRFDEQADTLIQAFQNHVLYFFPIALSLFANGALKKLFRRQGMDEEIASLSTDLSGNPTAEMGELQVRLASGKEFRSCADAEEFMHRLEEDSFSEAFTTDYRTYLERFGFRGMGEIDIANPRTYEDIPGIYRTLRQIGVDGGAMDAIRQKKKEAYERLLTKAQEMGQEAKFMKLSGRLQWAGLRESPKYLIVTAIDILRRNALAIAEKLVAEGRLTQREDIFLCDVKSIARAQEDASFSLISVVERNRAAHRLTENVRDWPRIVDSRGKIFTASFPSGDGALGGEPVSHGVATGAAMVLHTPFEKPLEKGDILVIKAAEPSWTPMFLNAAAVVMEVGGTLQHGAIIAREYGIPCVTGVEGCTQLIHDGDVIEVDGTSGTVRFIQKANQELLKNETRSKTHNE